MQDFENKKIVLGICGGIAAYKSAFLVRELTNLGATVRVVMTASAEQFITPLTLQALSGQAVRTELWDFEAERAMSHIELARWADYLLIAPASANCLAKMAHGLADDLLSTLYLVTETPVIICPAMNRSMWAHPATKANCQLLMDRGVMIVGPGEGSQACGEFGLGRMSEVEDIIDALRLYHVRQILAGQKILITAGPTREMLDPVRYMSNRSSGKMGYALARAAVIAGAQVSLVSGPSALTPPPGVSFYPVNSAQDMYIAVMDQLTPGMIFIGAAAVADYQFIESASEKIKKQDRATLSWTMQKTPDILTAVVTSGQSSFVVGFAAESNQVIEHAREKLVTKKLDMIIANQVGDNLGFDCDQNQVTILSKQDQIDFKLMHKVRLAGNIIQYLAKKLKD